MRHGRFLAAAALLVLLVAAIFGQTAGHRFVNYDDGTYVVTNALVNHGFTADGVRGAFRPRAANWHPLTWFSHMLDVELFGLQPAGHHLENVLLHAANAVLLLGLLLALTGAFAPSLFVAALFAVHPLHVESVAWVAERKDVLSTLFSLLALAAWLGWLRRPARGRYVAALALFGCALAAKPMAVTLPLLLLLLDVWPLGRLRATPPARLLAEKLPWLLLALADGLATVHAQHAGRIRMIAPGPLLRLANAVDAGAIYLVKTVWPAGLAPYYPYPVAGIPWYDVAAAAALLAGLTVWAVRARATDPALLAGWLWYLVMLAPVLGLHQVGAQARADRYTYLPLTGVCIAFAWWAAPRIRPRWRGAAVAGAAALVAAAAGAAFVQTGYWRDSASLMERTLRVTGPSSIALNNLGMARLDEQLRPAEAVPLFEEAIRLDPRHRNARFNLGVALFRLGRYEQAIAAFGRVLAASPGDLEANQNIAAALYRLGRYEEAARLYARIAAAVPGDAESRFFLGESLIKLGRYAEAARQLAALLEIAPAYPNARIQLAVARNAAQRLTNPAASK